MQHTGDNQSFIWVKGNAPLSLLGFILFAVVIVISNIGGAGQRFLANHPNYQQILAIVLFSSIFLSFFFVLTANHWKVEPEGLTCLYGRIIPLRRISAGEINGLLLEKGEKNLFTLSAVLPNEKVTMMRNRDLFNIELTGEKVSAVLRASIENRAAVPHSEERGDGGEGESVPFYEQNLVEDAAHSTEEAAKRIVVELGEHSHTYRIPTQGVWSGSPPQDFMGYVTMASISGLIAGIILWVNIENPLRLLNNLAFLGLTAVAVFFGRLAYKKMEKKWLTVQVNADEIILSGTSLPPHSIAVSSIIQLEAIVREVTYKNYTEEVIPASGYLGIKTKQNFIAIEDIDFPLLQVLEWSIKSSVRHFRSASCYQNPFLIE